jgi:hypothetical protein
MFQWLVGGSFLAAGSAAATFSLIWAKRYKSFDVNDAAREGFSLARYEPMKRLLSEEDFEFLKSKPGIRPAMVRRLRSQRRRVFRAYLRELASDFNRLHRDARLMVATAPEEYSELVGALMGIQMRFWSALAAAELRLTVHSLGVGRIDVSGLLGPLEALHAAVYMDAEAGLESA